MDKEEEINAPDASNEIVGTPLAPRIETVSVSISDSSKYYHSSSIRFRCHESMMPDKYKPNMILEAKINKMIGHGSYGTVFLIENSAYVIKLFWETNTRTFDKPEECLEFNFWNQVMKKIKKEGIPWPSNWCEVYLIGTTIRTEKFDQKFFPSGTPLLLMPYYYRWDEIFKSNGISRNQIGLWHVWKTLLEATCDLETNWNLVHLDLKLANIMVDKNGNLRIIDFGLIQEKVDSNQMFSPFTQHNIISKKKQYPHNNNNVYKELYYVWPPNPCLLSGVMPYSIAILQFEMVYNRTIYKFQGTRGHWFKYLEDLQQRGYSKNWIHILHLSSSTSFSVCSLLEKVNYYYNEELKANPQWKKSWDISVSKNIQHNQKWRSATILNYLYNDTDPLLNILHSGLANIPNHLSLSINPFNDINHLINSSSSSNTSSSSVSFS